MQNELNPKATTIGLYQDPESGAFLGCLDENQAAAAVRAGFRLVAEGLDAAMTPEKDFAKVKDAASADDGKKGK